MKQYLCEMEGCGRYTPFRSTLKGGEYIGLKVCNIHYAMHSKGLSKEKKKRPERQCLGAFFQKHIEKVNKCENCGFIIPNPASKNVAHILPKSLFKSVMCNDDNVMYLCSDLDRMEGKGCHDVFDSSWEKAKGMTIFPTAVERFKKFEHSIEEKSLTLLIFKNAKK